MEGPAVGVDVTVRKLPPRRKRLAIVPELPRPCLVKGLDVPDYRQQADYDCGPDAVRCVCAFFGVGPDPADEAAYVTGLGTTAEAGTPPAAIATFLNRVGLSAQARSDMEIRDLLAATSAGNPVLCCIQDYFDTQSEEAGEQSGHWVVVTGVELRGSDLLVQVQDPSAGPAEFSARDWLGAWQDTDGVHDFVHFGIVVSRRAAGDVGFTTDGSDVHAEAAQWDEAEFQRRADKLSFLLELPDIRQLDVWSCGAASVAAVSRGFGVGPLTIDEWKRELGTNNGTDDNSGTPPENIVAYLTRLGLDPVAHREMALGDLEAAVRAGRPVICPIQAYGTPAEDAADESGHYVVVVGREPGYVVIQDPAIDNALFGQNDDHAPGRMLVADEKFLEVWHDVGRGGTPFIRFGISVGPGSAGRPLLVADRKAAAAPEGAAAGAGESETSPAGPEGLVDEPEGSLAVAEGVGPVPNCAKRGCVHYQGFRSFNDGASTAPVCLAFPSGIPSEIAYGDNLHLVPYPGDNGVTYAGPDPAGTAI